ncbi:MAG TPA: outer membrane protein assembly factor BamD [Longimicrobiales bacterium]|nr:outer membrane protein assembly factor BamD [Longimicrobiales bacterium]
MRFQVIVLRILVASVLVVAGACASRGGAIDQMTIDELMELGREQYTSGRYADAVRTLERLTLAFGYSRMDEARYYLADSYFRRREYLSAATEFTRLASESPNSPYAVEARYKVCEAYYHLSPRPELDQTYTHAAIDSCDALVLYYPDSEFADRAREMSQELVDKLARKLYLTAENYFRNRFFDSAIIYYEDVVETYPQSEIAPQALLRMVQAYLEIGYPEDAEATRERLLREYPGSAEAGHAREISIAGGT